jgi:hypothetical protein
MIKNYRQDSFPFDVVCVISESMNGILLIEHRLRDSIQNLTKISEPTCGTTSHHTFTAIITGKENRLRFTISDTYKLLNFSNFIQAALNINAI